MDYSTMVLAVAAFLVLDAVVVGCVLAKSDMFTGVRTREIMVRDYGLDKHGNRCVFLWCPRRIFLPFFATRMDTVSFPDAAAYEIVKWEGPTKFLAVYEAKRFLFVSWEKYVGLQET